MLFAISSTFFLIARDRRRWRFNTFTGSCILHHRISALPLLPFLVNLLDTPPSMDTRHDRVDFDNLSNSPNFFTEFSQTFELARWLLVCLNSMLRPLSSEVVGLSSFLSLEIWLARLFINFYSEGSKQRKDEKTDSRIGKCEVTLPTCKPFEWWVRHHRIYIKPFQTDSCLGYLYSRYMDMKKKCSKG